MVAEIKSSIELCDQPKEHQKEEEMRWSVTLATFFIRMTIPSLRVCFGVVYLELMQNEHMSNMDVSWIVAVFIACFNFSSPMSTTLSLYCSHRMLVFIGILLISLGLALCSLSLHLPYLVLSYGVLGGMGSSMASTNSFLATQKYFTKKRRRSSFFASLGTSLSFLVMPLAIYGLVTFFTLRGSFLLWSSIILNGLVGAMFYSSDVYYSNDRAHETIESHKSTLREPTELEKEDQSKDSRHNGIEINNDPQSFLMVKDQDKICFKNQNDNANNIVKNTKHDDIAEKNIAAIKPSFKVFQDANDSKHEIMKSLPELFEYEDCTNDDAFLDTKYHDMRPLSFLSTATSVESFKTMKSIYKSAENMFISVECMDMLGNNIVLEQDREFTTDNEELQDIETQRMCHQNENCFPEISDTTNKSIKNLEAIETVTMNVSRPFDMLSLKPLRNGIFLAYLLSSVINKQIHLSYIIYLPLIAVRVGCQQQIPALFAIIATSEFVGKFSFSLYSKKKSMPIRYVYIVVSIMSALSFVALLFGNGFLTLVLASTGLGLGMGTCVSLDPALFLQHFSAGLLSQSYGLILFATGAFSLIAYPLQGWALDKTESFKVLGIVMASLALIPAVSWLFTMIGISSEKKNIYTTKKLQNMM